MTEQSKSDSLMLELLNTANEMGKFAVHLGGVFAPDKQMVFEKGLAEDLYRLIDISHIATMQTGALFRIFLLTDKGWQRRAALRGESPN